jgi:hypothetical protein
VNATGSVERSFTVMNLDTNINNNTGNIRANITLGRVPSTIVAVEKQ